MRKKKLVKTLLSGFLAFLMVLSTGYTAVYAGEEFVPEQETETVESSQLDSGDEETSTEKPVVVNETEESTGTVTEESVQTSVEALLLNYLILESDYVSTPDSQYVVADIGDENTVVSEAVITYKNMSTGTEYQCTADTIMNGTMLFYLNFTAEQRGQYQITAICYTLDGNRYTIDVPATGANAVFGVDTAVETDPYAWITEDDCSEEQDTYSTSNMDAYTGTAISDGMTIINNYTKSTSGETVIVLDPGHGGSDSGATRTWNGVTYTERDINLKIALACKEQLESYEGVKVYLTRSDNSSNPSLKERAAYAQSVGANVLVSLHINSTGTTSTTATGAMICVPNANYNQDIYNMGQKLGNAILNKLAELGIANNGTYIRNATDGGTYADGSVMDWYAICRESKLLGITGIIVEHAYVSNESDCVNYLGSDDKIQKLGIQDAKAIAEYFNLGNNNTYNGVDYSAVYDYEYYINKYADLKAAFGDDRQKALAHFVNYGMKEGRQGCEEFNVTSYAYKYYDLRKAYKNDLKKYYLHYLNYGKKEGRVATGTTTMQGGLTAYAGVDYSAVYNVGYYASKYADLRKAYGLDDEAYLRHFVNYGMKEGRQGSSEFNVTYYKNRYVDLRTAYGSSLPNYYLHYINHGQKEKRDGKNYSARVGAVTKYQGTDYSAVYDYNYYVSHNSYVKNTYGNDDVGALEYFVKSGMKEGQQAIESFNVTSYAYRYYDLRKAYKNDLTKYYTHYIKYGKKEGRTATGTTTMQGGPTTYNGVDYSTVFNVGYYSAKYGDLKKAFGLDDEAYLRHFVNYGMKEGRQGNDSFIVTYYKSNYSDLQNAYGDNLPQYYLHYIRYGKNEKRIANQMVRYSIMGSSSVTVDQMVAYYNAHASYPSYYAASDAPDIRTFCQIYKEECEAEGVKTEVAFCQAMLETGFLSYGGDVSISQYNFAGMGATGGVSGLSFSNVREGIRAQVQHLKAYASTASLNQTCVDPRFSYVTRGCAPYVEWLGIQENPSGKGWASASNYGYTIKNNYIYALLKY